MYLSSVYRGTFSKWLGPGDKYAAIPGWTDFQVVPASAQQRFKQTKRAKRQRESLHLKWAKTTFCPVFVKRCGFRSMFSRLITLGYRVVCVRVVQCFEWNNGSYNMSILLGRLHGGNDIRLPV